MITVPPMVGVPRLDRWAGPSALISWPRPRLLNALMASGVPNSAQNIETAADNRTVFTGPPP